MEVSSSMLDQKLFNIVDFRRIPWFAWKGNKMMVLTLEIPIGF